MISRTAQRVISFIGAQVSALGLAFLLQITLARVLGVHFFGVYVFVVAFLNVASLVSRLGFDQLLLRDTHTLLMSGCRCSYEYLVGTGSKFVLAASVLLTALLFVGFSFVFSATKTLPRSALLMGALSVVPMALSGLRAQSLMSLGMPLRSMLPDAIVKPLLLLVLVALFASIGVDLHVEQVFFMLCGVVVIAFVLSFTLERTVAQQFANIGSPSADEYPRRAMSVLQISLAFLAINAAFLLASQLDVLLLGFVSTPDQVGSYAAASRIAMLGQLGLIAAQSTVAGQIRAAYNSGDRQELQRLLDLVSRVATLLGGGTVLALYFAVDRVLLLFGRGFEAAAAPAVILLAYQVINCVTGATGVTMNMTGMQRSCARSLFAAVGINALVTLPLAYLYGAVGAAVGTTLVMSGWNVTMTAYVRRHRHVRTWFALKP